MKKTQNKKLCSELIVDFLSEKKISHVFDLTGGMITYLEDAISKKRGMTCVPMHHEQAAGFAAEGYARKGQNFGVAIATSGPGATNLITAIGSCYFDSVPTMFIIGQVHTENLKKNDKVRQEGFQETDIATVVKSLTKYSVLVRDVKDVMYELEKAYYIMSTGRFGSVLIDIPINLQRAEVDETTLKHFFGSREHMKMEGVVKKTFGKSIPKAKITQLEKLLHTSKAPLVVVGNGVRLSNTTKELIEFVTKNNLPVVTSLLGIDSFPVSKNLVGYIGSNGNRDANIIFANADLVIALGSRLDVRQIGVAKFFNPGSKIVHVDIDESSIDYTLTSALSFESDLTHFFDAVKHITTNKKAAWEHFIHKVQEKFPRELTYPIDEVDPNTFFHELSLASPSKTTVSVDVGQNQMWCAQSWKVKKSQRLLFSGGMGAMGFSLPAAIGAWYADKTSLPIVTCGDGGIQINIQELETVSRNAIPLKLFVLNNKSLGMVREFQDLYFNKNHQSSVKGYGHPDFKKIAHAYDFEYIKMSSVTKNDLTIKTILKNKNPVLIEVELPITATLQPKLVYGHALDDQSPYLSDLQKGELDELKKNLKTS
jgi:acetolactate synthase-1/2/3 large subunit